MPEIAEVARAVHYIRKHLVGRTLQKVTAVEDGNVFGKVGTSHTEIMKKLTGKKVVDAGQQGKYFWMIMSSSPHLVMHFGMAGWLRFKSEHTYYYRKKEGDEEEQWPPKYWKVMFETDGKGEEKIEAAYVDLRRFGRVRLVDCPGKDIRQHSPLVENGPDPVQDKEMVTFDWLKDLCNKKKVPIKAMLLDQANISGIGNWVGDEIMFDARMHPEQYANTLSDAQIRQLHKSIHHICGTAVDLLADSDQFPESWLFKHRWGKGKKEAANTLPNGEKIVFLTVGGRTSAVVPSLQKKTGPVAKDISDAEEEKPKKSKGSKLPKTEPSAEDEKLSAKKDRGTKRAKEDAVDDEAAPTPKRGRGSKRVKGEEVEEEQEAPEPKKRGKGQQNADTDGVNGVKAEDIDRSVALAEKLARQGKKHDLNEPVENEFATAKSATKKGKKSIVAEDVKAVKEDGQNGRRRSGRLQR